MALNIRELFRKALDVVVYPAIDKVIKDWHTPFEVDDLVWRWAKTKIDELVDKIGVQRTAYGYHTQLADGGTGFGSFSLRDAFKTFIVTHVFPIVDKWVAEFKFPFKLDDVVWAKIRALIEVNLDKADTVFLVAAELEAVKA